MKTAGVIILVIVLALVAAAIWWVVYTRLRAHRLGLPPPPLKSYLPFSKSTSSYAGPQPAPGGIIGWINDRIRLFRYRNTRTAAGAYEGTAGGYNARYGGPHDDDAWDTRVGAYSPYDHDLEEGIPQGQQQHEGRYSSSAYDAQTMGPTKVGGTAAGYDYSSPYGEAYATGGRPEGEGYQMNLPVGDATTGASAKTQQQQDDEEERRGRPRSRSPAPGDVGKNPFADKNPFEDEAEPSNLSMRGVSPNPVAVATTTAGESSGNMSFAARKARGEEDRKSIFREDV